MPHLKWSDKRPPLIIFESYALLQKGVPYPLPPVTAAPAEPAAAAQLVAAGVPAATDAAAAEPEAAVLKAETGEAAPGGKDGSTVVEAVSGLAPEDVYAASVKQAAAQEA